MVKCSGDSVWSPWTRVSDTDLPRQLFNIGLARRRRHAVVGTVGSGFCSPNQEYRSRVPAGSPLSSYHERSLEVQNDLIRMSDHTGQILEIVSVCPRAVVTNT